MLRLEHGGPCVPGENTWISRLMGTAFWEMTQAKVKIPSKEPNPLP